METKFDIFSLRPKQGTTRPCFQRYFELCIDVIQRYLIF